MNQAAAKALDYLTGQKNLSSVSIEQLQLLADENPYFPVAQFLLTAKLKAEGDARFTTQANKTAIYFDNPLWFDYVLNQEINQQPEENFAVKSEIEPSKENEQADEQAHQSLDELSELENAGIQQEVVIKKDEPSIPDTSDQAPDFEKNTIQTEGVASQEEEENAALSRDTDKSAEAFINDLNTNSEEGNIASDKGGESIVDEDANETPKPIITAVAEEMAGASRQVDITTESFLKEAPAVNVPLSIHKLTPAEQNGKDQNGEEIDEHERMYRNIKHMLDMTTEEAEADVDSAEVPIDPYYTIDYFASQGIKLDFDPNPQDKLGRNLKKFTQWLKHMKKLGPEDAKADIGEGESEADIQQIADTSIVAKEVVTEAMAAVLEKQGKRDKAIELYNKLSFLNPDKSTYFADKIKLLKGN